MSRVQPMPTKKAFVMLALCLLAGLTLIACGGGEESTETQAPGPPASAADDPAGSSTPGAQTSGSEKLGNGSGSTGGGTAKDDSDSAGGGKAKDRPSPAGARTAKNGPRPAGSETARKGRHGSRRSGSAVPEKGKEPKTKPADADPPASLSDEEVCERDPSACGSDENAAPDYSNPDVRRAEERAAEPDPPTKCDSSDCEKVRGAER